MASFTQSFIEPVTLLWSWIAFNIQHTYTDMYVHTYIRGQNTHMAECILCAFNC